MHNTIGVAIINLVNIIFYSFNLLGKIIIYMNDERFNLSILTNILKNVVFLFSLLVAMPMFRNVFWPCHVRSMLICY